MKLRGLFLLFCLTAVPMLPSFAVSENPLESGSFERVEDEDMYLDDSTVKSYKKVTKDERIVKALEVMKGGLSNRSREAILGDNLTGKPMKVMFRNLAELNEAYASFDALGWKNKEQLYIFINEKHINAPKEALAALLSHEALHQDEMNSINEETYCWTLEAAVWTKYTELNPSLLEEPAALVDRENTIRRLFIKGGYTDKYIRKSVLSNAGYQNLPSRSPGFEDENL